MENLLNLKMLSPVEILNQKLVEPSVLNCGLKKRFPDETSDEIVSRLQGDFLKLICYERVERTVSRSQAEYNAMTGLIVVTRKLGKWNTFGYRTNNLECLKYYEALYLIDTNRLELYYDSVLLSLEQAYALLLNNQHDAKSNEKFFIYSNLSKAGYIVQPHRQHLQLSQGNPIQLDWSKDITPADKCVWRCLFESLKQPSSNQDISHGDNELLYQKVKRNMKTIEDAITNQRTHAVTDSGSNDPDDDWQSAIMKTKVRTSSSRKRKQEPSTSRTVTELEHTNDRFLDVLTQEQDVCNFKEIFDEIQVIQLDRRHNDNVQATNHSDLEFDFDLYLARTSFKQSDPGAPNYRIVIFKSSAQPPTRESIVKAFLKPTVTAPVLVFYINELMRVSAFLYRISL